MYWLWGMLAVLVALVVGGQVAFLRSTAGLKGSTTARVIRVVNIALLMIAIGIAVYAVLVVSLGGR